MFIIVMIDKKCICDVPPGKQGLHWQRWRASEQGNFPQTFLSVINNGS